MEKIRVPKFVICVAKLGILLETIFIRKIIRNRGFPKPQASVVTIGLGEVIPSSTRLVITNFEVKFANSSFD